MTQVPLPPECHLHLPVLCEGMVDAVAMWFELHLDSEVSFCTAPSWDLSWEQALFPMSREMEVQRGDAVRLLASCSDILLKMEVEGIQRSARTVGECSLSSKNVESTAFLSRAGRMDQLLVDMDGIDKTVAPLESKQLLAVGSIDLETPNQDDESRKGQAEMEELAETAASTLLTNCADDEKYYVERGELSRINDGIFMEAYRKAIAEALQVIREAGSSSSAEGSELEDGMTRMMLDPPIRKEQSLNCGDSIPCERLGSTVARMDSGDEGSTESSSEDYADCIVLDMAWGPSLFGLLAAKEG